MEKYNLRINTAILWVAIYLGIILFYTFLDLAIWRKLSRKFSSWLNIVTTVICVCGFVLLLKNKTEFKLELLSNITITGILLAIGCSVLFYFLLDNCLDPIFESIFPASEEGYQETINSLMKSPITSLLQVCIIAPIIEEILMRGFVLNGLENTYGITVGLIISSILFALLHFNMVQTLSAFVCGIILGLLYVKTGSILCCIIAHCGYNFISYTMMIYQRMGK